MTTAERPRRADATRNRDALLAAAEEEFAERGLEASIADIARRAGVAKGTVFRHFASKEDLIAAIVGGHFAALRDEAHRLLDGTDPGAGLLAFLTAVGEWLQHHDLSVLQAASEGHPDVTDRRDELHAGVGLLVDRAREAGAVRADVTGTDVFVLMCAPAHALGFLADPPADLWRRYLAILFDGLGPEGARALPRPAPSWP